MRIRVSSEEALILDDNRKRETVGLRFLPDVIAHNLNPVTRKKVQKDG
jgi:hypothetical protein